MNYEEFLVIDLDDLFCCNLVDGNNLRMRNLVARDHPNRGTLIIEYVCSIEVVKFDVFITVYLHALLFLWCILVRCRHRRGSSQTFRPTTSIL